MVVKAKKIPPLRRSDKVLITVVSLICICIILATGVGLYFLLSIDRSMESDINDEELDESTPLTAKWVNNTEIKLFRKYLRFETISLESDFGPCVEFLKKQGQDLDLTVSVHYPANKQNPVLLMTWPGSQPELSSILLNSHMDVVPVAEEYWNHPPFAARIEDNGDIYARGAQDMKSVGMQYLAAIRALKQKGMKQLKRTIHLTYVPDEESGGILGMGEFVKTNDFKTLNIGCALDEGYPSETDELEVYYAERTTWSINITTHGHSGHSSLLFNDTAVEKLNYIMNKFLELRKNESRKLNEEHLPYGNVTSINLTILRGGFKANVVPPDMSVAINIRLPVYADWDELERTINQWVHEAGENIDLDIYYKDARPEPTRIDYTNPYWEVFKEATDQFTLLNKYLKSRRLNITPAVFRAGTDSRYLRGMNISALGFSPLMKTKPMLHEHNEYINADTYLKGIEIYETIILMMGNFE